jgi:hypothetical protein
LDREKGGWGWDAERRSDGATKGEEDDMEAAVKGQAFLGG